MPCHTYQHVHRGSYTASWFRLLRNPDDTPAYFSNISFGSDIDCVFCVVDKALCAYELLFH